jgi:uncharacterized protein
MIPAERELIGLEGELVNSLRTDRLQLILLPTEQCNFRCTYCYEDFAIGRMSDAVVAGVKRLMERRAPALSRLQLSWFGGEPLLARSIIEDVSSYAQELQAELDGFEYIADMTTNGYKLDADAADHLANLGIRTYQVTVDGPAFIHNRTRVRADGGGSFERIWGNLRSIRESVVEVDILIRVHLTPENLSIMPGFLATLKETFLSDSRFSVHLKNVVPLGGPNDEEMDFLGPRDEEKVSELEALVRDGTTSESVYSPEEVCYAARANSLLVRADGRIGKCTVGLSDDRNMIGRLLSNGTLQINNEKLRPWLKGWETGDVGLIACPYESMTRERPLLQIGSRPPD